MPLNKTIAAVFANKLFAGVDTSKLQFNFNIKEFLEFSEGDLIFKSGDQSEFIFLVVSGGVKIKLPGKFGTPMIVQKKHNEFFGEKEIIENSPRKSSCVAERTSLLYPIRKSEIIALTQVNPQLKKNLLGEAVEEDPFGSNEFRRRIILTNPTDRIKDLDIFKRDTKEENSPFDLNGSSENTAEDLLPENTPDLSYMPPEPDIIPFNDFNSPVDAEDKPIPENTDAWSAIGEGLNPEEQFPVVPNNTPFEDESSFGASSLFKPEESEYTPPTSDETTGSSTQFSHTLTEETPESSDVTEDTYVDILLAIEKIGSSIILDELFLKIPTAVIELVRAQGAFIFVHEQENGELWTIESHGGPHNEIRIKDIEGLQGDCFVRREIINIKDTKSSSSNKYDLFTSIEHVSNTILFPIMNKNGVLISILQLVNSWKGAFDEQDEKILSLIIPFISDAIENALDFQRMLNAEKLLSLGRLSNLLTNDIKRPLLMIRHYIEFLKTKGADEETVKLYDIIASHAGAVVDLVQVAKEFSDNNIKINSVDVEISTVIDEYLTLLAEYTASRNVKVFRKFEGTGVVHIDKRKLYQAVYQIVKNGCDAMPQGGKIFFTVKKTRMRIEIHIKDEGLGIPDSIKDRIFEPFMSHGKKGATGLGLNVAEKLVKAHDGEIQVQSDLGEGTVFIISLPSTDVTEP